MAFTKTLNPPIDSTIEQENITFDYGPIMAQGVTILSVTETVCSTTINGNLDPTPQQRIISTQQSIQASPSTGQPLQAVVVLVGRMVANVTYLLQCVVQTSDNQELSLWAYLPCIAPE